MNYEELLIVAEQNNLLVKEQPLSAHDGLIKGKRIAIRKDIETKTEKACTLAEELGHHYTTYGDILDQSDPRNRKQEILARTWAYDRQIGLIGLISAYEHGCQNRFEIAEYLDVTEEFLGDALKRYQDKYGIYTVVDNYVVYFVPNLAVCKIM